MDTETCQKKIQYARQANRLQVFLQGWQEGDDDGGDGNGGDGNGGSSPGLPSELLVDLLLHAKKHKLPRLRSLCATQLKTFLETRDPHEIRGLLQ